MAIADELGTLKEHLERFRGVTLQTLDMVPEDKLSFRPMDDLRSVAEQFLHIAQVEDFYGHGLLANDWNFGRVSPTGQLLTRPGLKQRFAAVRAFTFEHLDKLQPAQLEASVSVPQVPVDWPLRGWLWYLLEHEVHHKAQLSLYLRRLGIIPPFFAYVLPTGVRPDIR